MDIKKEFGTSKAKEQEGIWSDFGDGCQVKIAVSAIRSIRKRSERFQNRTRRPLDVGR